MDYVWFALIGLCAGWLAGQFMKGSGFGLVGDLIIGVIGAILGASIFRALGLSANGQLGQLLVATVGAIVLLALLHLVKKTQK